MEATPNCRSAPSRSYANRAEHALQITAASRFGVVVFENGLRVIPVIGRGYSGSPRIADVAPAGGSAERAATSNENARDHPCNSTHSRRSVSSGPSLRVVGEFARSAPQVGALVHISFLVKDVNDRATEPVRLTAPTHIDTADLP